ncbi:diaminobutyrate acetyltransferase, partial [Streptomyces sp. SID10244]|nr:diaminobutyrate acetyltransferase [Streptomyces sp. SID10244]
ADARGLRFERRDLFAAEQFPDAHEPEDLYILEPTVSEF